MANVEYPCTACAKRERCTGRNYQCCQKWCEWFSYKWSGLAGAEDREKYKAWLDLMIQRSEWRKENNA